MVTDFCIKHPMFNIVNIFLLLLQFTSPAEIKQILTLTSNCNIYSQNSKPSIYGDILISTSIKSKKFGLKFDNATKGLLQVYTSNLDLLSSSLLHSKPNLNVRIMSGSSMTRSNAADPQPLVVFHKSRR